MLPYNAWAISLKTAVDIYGPPGIDAVVQGAMLANRSDIETRIGDEGKPDLRKLVTTHSIGKAR